MTLDALAVLAIGGVSGFRHALEADHLAAVTTLTARQSSLLAASRLGLAWGLGHSASIGAVALLLVVLDVPLPEPMTRLAEMGVALLLILLGLDFLRRSWTLVHRGAAQAAAEPHAVHDSPSRGTHRSFGFGLMHGLAGSGAVIVLLMAASEGRATRLGYFLTFSAGTIAGMVAVTLLVATAARAAGRRGSWLERLQLATSLASVAVGCWLAYRVATAAGS